MFLFCAVCCAVFYNYLRIFLLIWISFGPILSGFLKRFWRNQSHLNWNSILPTASSVTFMTLTPREKVLSQISKSDWWMVLIGLLGLLDHLKMKKKIFEMYLIWCPRYQHFDFAFLFAIKITAVLLNHVNSRTRFHCRYSQGNCFLFSWHVILNGSVIKYHLW